MSKFILVKYNFSNKIILDITIKFDILIMLTF